MNTLQTQQPAQTETEQPLRPWQQTEADRDTDKRLGLYGREYIWDDALGR